MSSEQTKPMKVYPLSIKEICSLYKISRKTWKVWYSKKKEMIGERLGGKFSSKQVQIIFDEFGCP